MLVVAVAEQDQVKTHQVDLAVVEMEKTVIQQQEMQIQVVDQVDHIIQDKQQVEVEL